MAASNNKGIIQKTAERIIMEVMNENYSNDPEAFILNEEESKKVRIIYNRALLWSAFLGAIGVIVLFCTKYAFPHLFPRTTIHLPLVNIKFTYNIIFFLYGLVLAYIELYLLYYVNLKAIKKLILACNYPHPSNPNFKEEIIKLAALSNIAIRIVVTRIGGKTLGRVFVDMLGVPVFAFWNVLASRKILLEAQIRIFSKPLTEKFVKQMFVEFKDNPEFKNLLYDTLQYISMIKRTYNYSHFMFGDLLLKTFSIPFEKNHILPPNYFERLDKTSVETKRGIEKIIIFGMVVDGKISSSEVVMIKKAIEHHIITLSITEIVDLCRNYKRGKGLPGLVSIV
jgi:hypothetical protein